MGHHKWAPCVCCGKLGPHFGYGYRRACYRRWVNAGRPESGPPPATPRSSHRPPAWALEKAHETIRAARRARLEDYADLVLEFGQSREEAAERLGITVRTAYRYENALRAIDGDQNERPPRRPPGRYIGRLEDYAELTRGQKLTLYQAAERLGVSSRTAWRYEKTLRGSETTTQPTTATTRTGTT